MAITISGDSPNFTSVAATTITNVTNISSNAADTPVILGDSGTNYNTCRAWVNFNGTGTIAIRADFNVTSITDGGVGTYTVNFTTNMPDANYCTHVTVGGASTGQIVYLDASGTTYPTQAIGSVAIKIREGYTPFGAFDVANANVSIFR